MEELDAPICLKRARDEMLLALDASSPEEESEHKALAEDLIVRAVRSMQRQPERIRDWSLISPSREN